MPGSVLMATSCDGNIMGRTYVLPAREYPKDAKVRMFYDFPAPSTWEDHEDQVRKGDTFVGYLPVERTYRCILAAGHLADSITGGINEHGLSMGIEYLSMKPELANRKGIVSRSRNAIKARKSVDYSVTVGAILVIVRLRLPHFLGRTQGSPPR